MKHSTPRHSTPINSQFGVSEKRRDDSTDCTVVLYLKTPSARRPYRIGRDILRRDGKVV